MASSIENIETIESPFRRFVTTIGVFPTAFTDAMTYYECLAYLVKYLDDTVIPAVNENAEALAELQTLFVELKSYVEHYFDNLDVQNEINRKLDQMASDGSFELIFQSYFSDYVNPRLNIQDRKISQVEDLVASAVSGKPKAVTSTSDMTDHNQIYVLTTDGKWYYWDGTTWSAGGSYQGTSLATGSVSLANLDNELAGEIYKKLSDITKLNLGWNNNSNSSFSFTTPMIIKTGTTVTFSDDFVSNYHWRFKRVNVENGKAIKLSGENITPESTDTTYTFANTEYCVLSWRPIDNNWETENYTVDKTHMLDNDDVTGITYFLPKNDRFKLIDLDSTIVYNNLFGSVFYASPCVGYYAHNRFGFSKPLISNYPILCEIESGYQYGLATWSGDTPAATRLSDSGWVTPTAPFMIPANTYFTLTVRKSDNSDIINNNYNLWSIFTLNSYANFTYVKNYIDTQMSSIGTYNYDGVNLDMQYKHGFEASNSIALSTRGSCQGFDSYGNYMVQLHNGGNITIQNLTTGTELGYIEGVGFGHGDTCQFSDTFYDSDDILPLLYVTSDATPALVHVVRIQTTSSASIVKTYDLGIESGYYSGQCFDFENGLIYNFGYKANSFNDGTNNATIVSVFDMKQETLISGSTYSLELVERYEIPFIYCIQGQKFLNGLCYLVSSYQTQVSPTKILVYDPIRKLIVAKFTDLPNSLQGEMEDICFIPNSTTGKYELLGAVSGGSNYIKLKFL